MAKAKLKILYEEGYLDVTKPFTYSFELRKWKASDQVDYVVEWWCTTGDLNKNLPPVREYYVSEHNTHILNTDGDYDAIRIALGECNALRERVDEMRVNHSGGHS